MCEAVGHRVVALRRVAFGPLRLKGLPEGRSRCLSAAEVERLQAAAAWESRTSGRSPTPATR
jgi:23S rRNA pseudouridine2605 synthase